MNAAPTQDASSTEPVAAPSKFVLACFLFFFGTIAAIAFGDLIGAMFR